MRLHTDEMGAVAAIAIVLLALLFFTGTIMALAVESNLHTGSEIRSQDALHYAAESAVARGVAASSHLSECPSRGSMLELGKDQDFLIQCHPVRGLSAQSPTAVTQWGVPEQRLDSSKGSCITIGLDSLGTPSTVWTVIGWRKLTQQSVLQVWLEKSGAAQACVPSRDAQMCSIPKPGPAYILCRADKKVSLHIASDGGAAQVSSFVVRGTRQGSDCITTVIGSAGFLTKEADLVLPKCGSAGAFVNLWNAVLP